MGRLSMPVDQTRESWKPGQDWLGAIEEINYIKELGREMGGEYGVARQHRGGRYTIRERIDKFLDPDSFFEAGPLVGGYEYDENGDLREFTPGAFVMGMGQIDGRNIVIGGDDFTISGGSPHNVSKGASQFATPLAAQYGLPYVQLIEGVGHSAKRDEEEGRMALPGGRTWWRHINLLNKVPVASGIMGSVAGAPAAFALLSHFTVMIKGQSQIFPSGPPVVRRAIGETFNKEELGGSKVHVYQSGQVDNEAEDEEDAFDQIKQFLSYLPDTTNDVTGARPQRRRPEPAGGRAAAHHPREPQARLQPSQAGQAGRRSWGVLRDASALGRRDHHRLRADRRICGRRRGQRPLRHGRCDEWRRGRQIRPFRRPLRRVQPADGDLPRHARLHVGLAGRTQPDHAPRYPRADRGVRSRCAQGRVQHPQELRRRRRCSEQHGRAERRQHAVRLASRRVGRHPRSRAAWRRRTGARSRRPRIPRRTGR